MNKEKLAKKATQQYEVLASAWSRYHNPPSRPRSDPYRSTSQTFRLEQMRRDTGRRAIENLGYAEREASRFYEKHHAELYDLAREEMEADGIAFNEGDPKQVTTYHFGEEIAELEQRSPLDALGAKIIQISERHQAHAETELVQ